jgi:hypothetical protein
LEFSALWNSAPLLPAPLLPAPFPACRLAPVVRHWLDV